MAIKALATHDHPIENQNLSGGMVSNSSDSLLPESVASLSINFHYDVLGKAIQRSGTTKLGDTVNSNQTCTGLHQYISSDGATNRLIACFSNSVYSYNGTAWANIDTTSTSAKIRFANFLNRAYRVGGGDSTESGIGTGSFDGTNCSGAPTGKFIAAYKQRLYIAGNSTYPDRLFFSTIASSSGTITWNQTSQYLDVNPEDGNNITALSKTSNLLLIWKERAMYRWNGTSTDAELLVDIGTTSQESVAQVKGLTFFFNPNGIYITNGGYPTEISRPIYDWIKNMSASYYDDVSGFGDEDHYYCSIGNVTKDGRTFTNVWLVYTISSQNWHVYTFADSFRFMTKYITTSNSVTYAGGDTSGDVQTLFSGNTDNGTSITYEYETRDEEWGNRASTKNVSDIAVFTDQGFGGIVSIAEENNHFQPVGEITDTVTILKSINKRGRYLKLKIEGINASTPVHLNGYSYLKVDDLGVITNN